VTVGQTASLQFAYDTGATISITGWSNSAATPATGIPVSIANSALLPYRQYSYTAGTTVMTPLFPTPSGYTVFAGNCTDNNPVGLDTTNNVFYNNPGTSPVSVTAGGTTTTTILLYDVPVTVVNSTGVVQPNAVVTATETTGNPSPYTAVCTSGAASGAAPTLGMVTTDAAGTSTTAMPLGHWSIKAVVGPKQGTTKVWRRITGVFATTATGASTGSALTTVTVTVTWAG
jgi:hypothetical protein